MVPLGRSGTPYVHCMLRAEGRRDWKLGHEGESAGECGEHLQELTAFDSALPELSLHVANLIDLCAACVYGQLCMAFPNMLVKQVDLAMQLVAKIIGLTVIR